MLGLKTISIFPKQQSVKPNTLESKRLICNLEHRSPFHGREPREPWSPLGTMSSHLHLPESHLLRLSSKLRAKLFKNFRWRWHVLKFISSDVLCIVILFFFPFFLSALLQGQIHILDFLIEEILYPSVKLLVVWSHNGDNLFIILFTIFIPS